MITEQQKNFTRQARIWKTDILKLCTWLFSKAYESQLRLEGKVVHSKMKQFK